MTTSRTGRTGRTLGTSMRSFPATTTIWRSGRGSSAAGLSACSSATLPSGKKLGQRYAPSEGGQLLRAILSQGLRALQEATDALGVLVALAAGARDWSRTS